MKPVFIAVGSNLGDRSANIAHAREKLSKTKGVRFLRSSELYETAPVGGPPQGLFLNGVWEVETDLEAKDLLQILHRIEAELGRERKVRNEPREIDLDLLFYGDLVFESSKLTVPHPRLHERLFVLEPLAELAPKWIHPKQNQTIEALFQNLYENHSKSQAVTSAS